MSREVQKNTTMAFVGKALSYGVFTLWSLVTIIPLVWMGYSSFKSNEELTRDIYALPRDLFDNRDDEYVIISPSLNVIPDYNVEEDARERLVIESATIAPGRSLLVHFLLKEKLPPEIASRKVGEKVLVRELPGKMQWAIHWKTLWFNYRSALVRGGLVNKFFNSVLYAGLSTFLIVLLGSMISFGITKMPFKKISAIVTALIGLGYLVSINSVIIPLFLMLRRVGLTDSHLGIILVYVAFGLPLSVLLSSQFMRGLPNSLVESAYMDGASALRTFLSIILPMTTPVIVTISIISALGIWNEFLLVLVLSSSDATKSLPVGVYSFSSLTSQQLGWQLAALVIATIPVMVLYLSFNRQLTRGVVAGAVKG